MQEIIIPDDGLLYRTSDGRPVMQMSLLDDATVLTLFSKYENSRLILFCHDSESGIHIGNGQKNISLVVNEEKNEIRIVNENSKITHLFDTTEDGGQIELCDNEGRPIISMGLNSGSIGSIFLRDKEGKLLVGIWQDKENGSVDIQDVHGNCIWSSLKKGV